MAWIHLEFEKIVKETDSAFLVLLEDGDEHWLPKSQVSDPDDYVEGDEGGVMSITEWIANEKGLG